MRVPIVLLVLLGACGRTSLHPNAGFPASPLNAAGLPDAGVMPDYPSSDAATAPASSDAGAAPPKSYSWKWENPLPTGNPIFHLVAPSPSSVWAFGDFTTLHFDGASWTTGPLPWGDRVSSVYAAAPDNIWMISSSMDDSIHSRVHRFDGQAWQDLGLELGNDSFVQGSGSDIWIQDNNRRNALLHWNGALFDIVGLPTEASKYIVLAANDPWVFPLNQHPDISYLHQNGAAWVSTTLPGWLVGGSGWNDQWAYDGNYNLFHSDGSGWSPFSYPLVNGLKSFYERSASDVYFGTDADLLHFDGATIARLSAHASPLLSGNANEIWTASDLQGVFRNRDGIEAEMRSPAPNVDFSAVWAAPDGQAVAVGRTGAIWHRRAESWVADQSPTLADLARVHGCADDDIWAVGDRGAIVHFDGTTWAMIAPALTTEPLIAIGCIAPADVWIAGQQGGIYHFDLNGWTTISPPSTPFDCDHGKGIVDLLALAPNEVYVLGFDSYFATRYLPCQKQPWLNRWNGVAFVPLSAPPPMGRRLVMMAGSLHVIGDAVMRLDHGIWTNILVGRDGYNFSDAAVAPDQSLWVIDHDSVAHHFANGAWQAEQIPSSRALYGLAASRDSILTVGERGSALARIVK